MSINQAKEVIKIEAEGVTALLGQIDSNFDNAIEMIMNCPARVIITGIGKSGIIGQKIAATLNSTGTPAFFLHPVEAMHGDLGIVDPQDVILAISYSGETAELNLLLPSLKKRGAKLIAMTGDKNSNLAKCADAILCVKVPKEACPLGLAPTASTTAALAMGDALAVVLLNKKQFNERDFRRNHPGGSLGERLKVKVSEVMLSGEQMPLVPSTSSLQEAILELNKKNLGAVLIMEGKSKVAGILTDGDIRRLVSNSADFKNQHLTEVMTQAPKSIEEELLAADALSIMQRHEITVLPVKNKDGALAGILHLQDLLGKGEFRFLV